MAPNPLDRARLALWTRRRFLGRSLSGVLGAASITSASCARGAETPVFVGAVPEYSAVLGEVLARGLRELGIGRRQIAARRILLKPNLVEPSPERRHVNTDPLFVRAVAETLRSLGAAEIVVAEGAGHRRDTFQVLEDSGMAEVLAAARLPFVDLNYEPAVSRRNLGGFGPLGYLNFPRLLEDVDMVVSLPKLKTHHWVGVTLSMKNLFGVMPGLFYGWPKNVLHVAGIESSILDITATLRPALAIVDGIVGMEGDGPIMGPARRAGVVVMGSNLPAVDATAARLMGIRPERVGYLAAAAPRLGPVRESAIAQRGETIASSRTPFTLRPDIPAQRALMG